LGHFFNTSSLWGGQAEKISFCSVNNFQKCFTMIFLNLNIIQFQKATIKLLIKTYSRIVIQILKNEVWICSFKNLNDKNIYVIHFYLHQRWIGLFLSSQNGGWVIEINKAWIIKIILMSVFNFFLISQDPRFFHLNSYVIHSVHACLTRAHTLPGNEFRANWERFNKSQWTMKNQKLSSE